MTYFVMNEIEGRSLKDWRTFGNIPSHLIKSARGDIGDDLKEVANRIQKQGDQQLSRLTAHRKDLAGQLSQLQSLSDDAQNEVKQTLR
jgi:hypothetical protein